MRWVVLVAAVIAFGVTASLWSGKKPAPPSLRVGTLSFVMAIDLQLLIGLVLYVAVSPLTRMAFQNMRVAMKDHELRFFSVEHTTYMLLAVIAAHLGAVFSRKAQLNPTRYRWATIAYAVSLLLILAGIPWGRPLLRLGG